MGKKIQTPVGKPTIRELAESPQGFRTIVTLSETIHRDVIPDSGPGSRELVLRVELPADAPYGHVTRSLLSFTKALLRLGLPKDGPHDVPLWVDVPATIKKIRKEKGITKTTFAASLGVSIVSVSYWENGKRSPSLSTLQRIAQVFDLSPTDFCLITDKTSASEQPQKAGIMPMPVNVREELPAIIRRVRIESGLSMEKFAERIGMSTTSVSYWERGERFPSNSALLALVNALGLPVDVFFVSTENPSKVPDKEPLI